MFYFLFRHTNFLKRMDARPWRGLSRGKWASYAGVHLNDMIDLVPFRVKGEDSFIVLDPECSRLKNKASSLSPIDIF